MILIKNANVYSPEYLGKKDILIAFDRIAYIDDNIIPNLPDVEIIDAQGKFLVPGFIDQHVHIIGGGGEGGFHSRTPEFALSDATKAGVTTIVGLLGTDGITRSVESLVAKTKALNNEGLSVYCLTSSYQYPPLTLTGQVGKDIAFIEEIIGCKLALSDHRGSHPTNEEIIRLVSDIRVASLVSGKAGVLHIHVGAAPQGIDPIFEILSTTDIPINHFRPTHMGRHTAQAVKFTHMGGYADFTAKKEMAQSFAELVEESAAEFLTISSDSNGSLPRWDEKHEKIIGMGIGKMTNLYDTVRELIVSQGMPIEKALPFITKNVAQALEIYPKKGAIQVGSDADIVLLDKDFNVDSVITRGQKMMIDKNILVKGMFED